MADNLRVYGFRWVANFGGGSHMPDPIRCRVASAYQATANPGSVSVGLNIGDPVKLVNDGSVALAAAGESIYGVIVGIGPYYDASVGAMTFGNALPGGTTYGTNLQNMSTVHVVPVQGQMFQAVCDDQVNTTEAAYTTLIHTNVDHVFQPSSTDRRANPLLDISTTVTATAGWRILDIQKAVNIDFTGLYVPLLVTCNEVQSAPYVTTGV